MQAGDIILVRGQGPISRSIRFFTKSKYSHAALALSKSYVLEIDLFFNGIKIRKLKKKHYDIYRLNRELTPVELTAILNHAHLLNGKKYDYRKIFSLMIELILNLRGKRIMDNPERIICSDVIDSSYQAANIDLVPMFKEQDTTPGDIGNSDKIILVEKVDKNFFDSIKKLFKC